MKKIFLFMIQGLILIILVSGFISTVSASKIEGSFTITAKAVKESEEKEKSFLDSLKDFLKKSITGESIAGEFEIEGEIPAPEKIPESESGGRRPIPEENYSCISSWKCGDWSECTNSHRLRYCVDENRCDEYYIKLEGRDCIEEKPAPPDFGRYRIVLILGLIVILLAIIAVLLSKKKNQKIRKSRRNR